MIQLWLVRHGQTFDNQNQTLAGHSGGELTPQGEKQAADIGTFLKAVQFEEVYVSDLKRATQTFEFIKSKLDHAASKVEYLALLREKNAGVLQG